MRFAVSGSSGQMGRLVLAALDPSEVVAVVSRSRPPLPAELAAADVMIDFSSPIALRALLPLLPDGVALVTGTTGLDEADVAALDERARRGPVLHSPNFSPGIALLTRLLADAAAAWPQADLEIVETHHRRKADAPSGTALALARAAAKARGADFDDVVVYGRNGQSGERPRGEIGIHAVRAGSVFGEHTAILAAAGELIELRHSATSRSVFADGAIQAARWIVGRTRRRYTLSEVGR